MSTSEKITKAFRKLRNDGYFARRNWLCCQSCGCAAVPEEHSETYVFFHAQDADYLKEQNKTYLAWNGNGNLIRQRCEEVGLHVVWSGSEAERILVSEKALQ